MYSERVIAQYGSNLNFPTAFSESLPYPATTEMRETVYEIQEKVHLLFSRTISVFRLEHHEHNI
jgi:hypothetical protein